MAVVLQTSYKALNFKCMKTVTIKNLKIWAAFAAFVLFPSFQIGAQEQPNQSSIMQRMLAKMQSARNASADEKTAVRNFIEEFKNAFGGADGGKSLDISSLEKAINKVSEIDISKCPSDIKEKFDAFIKNFKEQLSELEKIFICVDLSNANDVEKRIAEYANAHPEIAEKIDKISLSLQKNAQEFATSLAPYLMP